MENNEQSFTCPGCNFRAQRLGDYLVHQCTAPDDRRMEIFLDSEPVTSDLPVVRPTSKRKLKEKCTNCKRFFASDTRLKAHKRVCATYSLLSLPKTANSTSEFKLRHTAFKKNYRIYEKKLQSMIDVDLVKKHNQRPLKDLLNASLTELGPIKYFVTLRIIFRKMDLDDSVEANCPSIFKPLLPADDINHSLNETFTEIKEIVDQFTERGSGFWIADIPELTIWIARFKPHRGGCDSFKLPEILKNKKCLLSIECQTDCFMYSVLSALYGSHHKARPTQYQPYIDLHDFSRWRGLVGLDQLDSFEKHNDISISVFTYDLSDKYVIPLYVTNKIKTWHVRLFWYKDHYYAITNFQALLTRRTGWHRYHCERCLNGFRYQSQLINHTIDCSLHPAQKLIMPYPTQSKPRRNFCERKDYKKELKHPIVIYADFECLNVPTNNPAKPFNHVPCSYGYIVVDWNRKVIDKKFAHGDNIIGDFLDKLKVSIDSARSYVAQSQKSLEWTDEVTEAMACSTTCWICEKPLGSDRVADHDHFTGEFRGAAHNDCNVNYQIPKRIPIFFHNLKNYDGHIIIDTINRTTFKDNLKIIPTTMEKYIGWFVDDLAFLDSFAFLSASLNTLSQNLTDDEKTEFLKQEWPTEELQDLMGKAAIPYEYLTSLEKFEETLPPISAFYSSLSDSNITEDMYQRLQRIWRQFNCQKLGDLIDLYLRLDVYMLAAVFENFRQTSIADFGIDPPHYMTCPGLSYAAALKKLKISIELFTQIDMLLMIENGIRGGFTTVAKRHAIANNPSTPNYNGGEQTHILYLDVNNLYGYAMRDMLPIGEYKWVNFSDESSLLSHIMCHPDDDGTGYVLEVDLEYPHYLHDEHNDFPMAPHKMTVTRDMLSPYAKKLFDDLNEKGTRPTSSEKLVSTFYTRQRYVVHYRNLKYYLQKGMIVRRVYRVLSFKQIAWLKEYIEFCTVKRQQASTPFLSSLYKLFVNSIFGKLMEDVRKHLDVKLVMSEKVADKRIANPLAQRFKILNEDKLLIQLKPDKVVMDKAIICGFTVLELSKLHVYKLYYDNFKQFYGDRVTLLYSDTDSLLIEIKTNTLKEDMTHFKDIMDFGALPHDHPLYDPTNKKKIGCLSDEMTGEPIEEVVAIKPKLYAIKSATGEKKRAKGVQTCVVDKKLSFSDYKTCLFAEDVRTETTRRIGADCHQISMYCNKKIAISPFEDKRYLLDDKISSYAYGHYKIK